LSEAAVSADRFACEEPGSDVLIAILAGDRTFPDPVYARSRCSKNSSAEITLRVPHAHIYAPSPISPNLGRGEGKL